MFCQFWYWYPLEHYACFAFEPTGIIGLNADLKVSFDNDALSHGANHSSQPPRSDFVSNADAKASLFIYHSMTKPPNKEAAMKVATAVLSTTARQLPRETQWRWYVWIFFDLNLCMANLQIRARSLRSRKTQM